MARNPNCDGCALSRTATTVCLWGDGPQQADIMLVGEAPSFNEDADGKPFIGQAGELLSRLLGQAGIERSSVYITNTVKCRPPGNRTPKKSEIAACQQYLVDEIATVQPRMIVALGAVGIKALTDATTLKDARGRKLSLLPVFENDTTKVLATNHPAAYFRSHSAAMLDGIRSDLKLASSSLEEDTRSFPARKDVLVSTNDTPTALMGLAALKRAKALTVDCEWTAGKGMKWPWTPGAEFYSLSISGVVQGIVWNVSIAWCQSELIQALIKELLEEKPVVCHNAMADLTWLYSLGIKPRLYADTFLLSCLIDETMEHSLESLGAKFCGLPAWKRPLWDVRPTDEEETKLLQYNADDTYATLLVHRALLEHLEHNFDAATRQDVLRIHNKLLVPVLPLYVEMALEGVGLNVGLLEQAGESVSVERTKRVSVLAKTLHRPPAEAEKIPASHKQTLNVLHERGIMVPSTGKIILEPISDRYPIIDSILGIRQTNKLLTTYIYPWLEMLQAQGTNRLHSIYKIGGVATGRSAATAEHGGSIHQMPRNNDIFRVRDMVIPRPGNDLVIGDACLPANTLVQTVERGNQRIVDVTPGTLVFGIIDRKPVVRRVVRQVIVGERQLYKLTLKTYHTRTKEIVYSSVRATSEHKFMLFDGSYQTVDNLKIGDRMLHAEQYTDTHGYPCIYTAAGIRKVHRILWEGVNGASIPHGHHVHHDNHIKTDNRADNLLCLTQAEHTSLHGKSFWQELDPEDAKALRLRMGRGISKAVAERGGHRGETNPNYGNLKGMQTSCSVCGDVFYRPPSHAAKFCSLTCRDINRKQLNEERRTAKTVLRNLRCKRCSTLISIDSQSTIYCSRQCYFDAKATAELNHIITAIELDAVEPVYCLEVEDCHNFILDNGIVSSNSQIELRVAAWLANERTMIRLYREDQDLHRATAARMTGKRPGQITKDERQAAKPTNFGLLYGQQEKSFITYAWVNYKVRFTPEQARQARMAFFGLYRDLPRWHAKGASIAQNEQFVTTPFGLTRHNIVDMTQAVNTPVQSTAFYLILLSTLLFAELLEQEKLRDKTRFILSVHDSIGTETPHKYARDVGQIMQYALGNPPTERLGVARSSIPVPFKGDVGYGSPWSGLTEL